MADIKRYLDLAGLQAYDEKIKAHIDSQVETLDDAIRGVDGTLTKETADRKAADKAINDIIGDWKSFDDEITITEAMNQLAGEDGILHDMQDAIDAVDAKVGDTTKLGDLGNTVDALLAVEEFIGNPDDLAKATIIESINANTDAIEAEVKRAQAAEKANADAIAAINNGESGVLASAKAYTDTKVGEEKTRAEGVEATLDAAIKAEVSRATSAEGTLQSNIQSSLEDAKAYTDAEVGKEKSRAEAAEKAINDAIGTWDSESFGGNTIAQAIALLGETFSVDGEFVSMADVIGLIDKEEDRATKAEEALGKRIEAHAAAVDGKVATLIGDDVNKSVRTIANEELTKQLIPENAKESLDTLEEIAAWIQAHPGDASEMNAAIQANATAIATEKTRAEGAESALDERLDAVEAAVGQGGNVDARIEAAINALDSTASHTAGADGLALNVAIVDGKLTSISGSIAANTYDAYGAAATAEANAKAYADGVYGAILPIETADINALFE